MKHKRSKRTSLCKMPFLFISLLIISACSLSEEKDIQFIRHNLNDFYAETIPYKEKITFTLSTKKILNGIVVPIKIDSIHDTDVFVVKTFEQVNSINKDREIYILVGLDSHINFKKGTLLSRFRLNDNDTYSTGSVVLQAFDENGELVDFGSGGGENEGIYGQYVFYNFKKEDLMKRKELTFEISGLYLLNYQEKETSFWTFNEKSNVEESFLKRVAHPESTKILYFENHEDGKIILYEDKSGFRASFYKEKDDYFQSTSNAEPNPEDGFSWTMFNNSDLALFAGVITDEQIEKVIVKQRTFNQKAKIININDGKRYWFTTFDVLEESVNGEGDPLKIEAFDKEGNLYWKSGVYEDGIFQGRTNR